MDRVHPRGRAAAPVHGRRLPAGRRHRSHRRCPHASPRGASTPSSPVRASNRGISNRRSWRRSSPRGTSSRTRPSSRSSSTSRARWSGEPLAQVKDGLITLARRHRRRVGSGDGQPGRPGDVRATTIVTEIPPAPVQQSRYEVADAIFAMEASGATSLYDAVRRAVAAHRRGRGRCRRATRAVVVLSDGAGDGGALPRHDRVDEVARTRSPSTSSVPSRSTEAFDDRREERPDRGRHR